MIHSLRNRLIAVSALFISVVLLSACSGSASCEGGSNGWSCKIGGSWKISKTASSTTIDKYDLANFNANNFKATTAQSNVTLKASGSPYVTISLYNNGSLVARKGFDMAVVGAEVVPVNPSAVTTWIRSHSNAVDDMRVHATGIDINTVDGSNHFVAEWKYESKDIGGASHAFYYSGGGYCEGSICYDPK